MESANVDLKTAITSSRLCCTSLSLCISETIARSSAINFGLLNCTLVQHFNPDIAALCDNAIYVSKNM